MRCLFFSHFAADPHANMAFDEWMFGRVLFSPETAILRFYTWQRPCITFGFHQQPERALALDQVRKTPVIRRITGGRALMHDPSEVTYSLAVNTDFAAFTSDVFRSLSESSNAIAEALRGFLGKLGVEVRYSRYSSPDNAQPNFFHKAPCFASRARYELHTESTKVVASAQRRLEGALLQHGSIKLRGVASHPALQDAARGFSGPFQPVDRKEFDRLSHLFSASLSDSLGLAVCAGGSSFPIDSGFCSTLENVKKKPLMRRDIIEQNKTSDSP
jgi:lipoate-protein ligase A